VSSDAEVLKRWRLVLGRYAEDAIGNVDLTSAEQRADRALEYLYARELDRRGLRASKNGRGGSLDPTMLTPLAWIDEIRSLFPKSVVETVQAHALDKLGMSELLKDPTVLGSLEPNRDLLRSILRFKGRASPAVQEKIREIARHVVDEIIRRLKPRIDRALSGRPNRLQRSQHKSMRNFDWRRTIHDNLVHYDPECQRIIAERLRFFGRSRRKLPWTVILCVDQSGSMADSVIHAAVMAAILTGLPSINVKLVVFDTSVVDLSIEASDPVSVLMSVQLGGGTDIGKAVTYCEGLVQQPTRTIFVLVSDFCEGTRLGPLLAAVKRMAGARVTMLGLASLADHGYPEYDHNSAQMLVARGMKIAALTPDRFADWLGEAIQ
jgi:Mg-chelatase subunit ChlD